MEPLGPWPGLDSLGLACALAALSFGGAEVPGGLGGCAEGDGLHPFQGNPLGFEGFGQTADRGCHAPGGGGILRGRNGINAGEEGDHLLMGHVLETVFKGRAGTPRLTGLWGLGLPRFRRCHEGDFAGSNPESTANHL